MTATMWLTLVASVGMATLVVPVARARHELAPPLGVLLADLLVWNLAWLAFQNSHHPQWARVAQCASTLAMAFAFDFVLAFVGKRRALVVVRRVVFVFHGALCVWALSRLFLSSDVGHAAPFRTFVVAGGSVTVVLIGWLLIEHYRCHHDASERAHTRLLSIGLVLWLLLAATEFLPGSLDRVPRMSALGMLLCTATMAVVMDRVRLGGPSRWWTVYTVALFLVAAFLTVMVFETFPADRAMLLARTVIFSVVFVAASREIALLVAQRRRRIGDLALIGRVTAQMAHDLQNPLAALKGASQVLERDRSLGHFDAARQCRMLEVIADQADRLSAIVDDYRRIGRIEPRPERLELSPLIRRTGHPPNILLSLESPGEVYCLADPELVARAVDNLVRNAVEAMPDGGEVSVTIDADDGWVDVIVADQGPGMDVRTCERACDDFFTTKAEGSGLGLAFVRRVAEVHGGALRISSRLGRGTRVSLRLPGAPEPSLFATPHVRVAA